MKATKKLFKNTIKELLNQQGTDPVLSEAALPAYAHNNPLIDYIFWQRLSIVSDYIKKFKKTNTHILDFGCGSGVLSYELGQHGASVYAVDLDLRPVKLLSPTIKFTDNITFVEGDIFTLDLPIQKFDFIIALDVLEHIPLENLPSYLQKFESILADQGQILVSGPTENLLYKIGRKLAGSDFTGDYHETTISAIKTEFSNQYKVQVLSRLIWPLTLFEVFAAKKL